MDAPSSDIPDDLNALKATLAVALAQNADDKALIAAQKLEIGIPTPSTALSARRIRESLRADLRQRRMWMCPQMQSWTQTAGGEPTGGGRRL
jgi:hypothetical protein